MRTLPIKVTALVFAVFFFFIIYQADNGSMPRIIRQLYAMPHGDKVGHCLLFGTLTFLINLGLDKRAIRLFRRVILAGTLAVTAIATLEELSQFLSTYRTPDFLDWSASLAGILLADCLIRHSSLKKENPPNNQRFAA